MKEVWKQAKLVDKRIDERYYVSNLGRVKSLTKNKVLVMKTPIDNRGYVNVSLVMNGKNGSYRLHRLVAMLFLPRIKDKNCINHIDGNKLNNCVDNLEWCNHYENNHHAREIGLLRNDKPVIQYKNGVEIARYKSINEASRTINVDRSSFVKYFKGQLKSVGKYQWKYAE